MSINVAIVDDKSINRETVKSKMYSYKEVNVMCEAKDGEDFLEQCKHMKLLPDVVLMDLEMPVLDGIATIQRSTAFYPRMKFVVLTVFEDNDKIFEAIKAGAHGYLLKEDAAVDIVDAITNVFHHDGIPMSPAVARKAMDMLRSNPTPAAAIPQGADATNQVQDTGLSDRELDVLKELVQGKNYKAIGEKLFISPLTVRKHVANIYNKLHVTSRTQVVNFAHKHNLL
ncbi:MAG: hypothetical protein RL660_1530 [Bacteroidota bacterium]|jgi:DNA-binding NarL/FixJ family response regulator